MLSAIAALALLSPPADQEFEGLLLDVPAGLKFTTNTQSNFRSYLAEVTETSVAGVKGATQAIAVVVTDLDKLPNKPTPEQVIRLHERQSRTRAGFAGQLMKVTDTTIDGQPMTVVVGSAAVALQNGTPVGAYHVSAATTFGNKAYEVTWYTYRHGQEFSNAVLAVRNLRFKKGDEFVGPVKLVGTEGNYSLLGVPFNWRLPTATTVIPRPFIKDAYAGRYQGNLTIDHYFAQVEIIQFKEAPKAMTLAALAREMSGDWLPETGGPEPVLEGGIYRLDNLTIPNKRKGRIEFALKDKVLVGLMVSCPDTKDLPNRNEVGLSPQP